jgi:hypothetical protein
MTKREFLKLTTGLGLTIAISNHAKSENLNFPVNTPKKYHKMKSINLNPGFIDIIKDAAKAPSGHNTQPWKFEVNEKQITIRPNFDRRLSVVDADDHALFTSLGCALENLILSAKAHRFSTKVTTNFANGKNEIVVDLMTSENEQKDVLYDFIQSRQSTRAEYGNKPIEQSKLEQLKEQTENECVEIIYITDKDKVKELEPFIIEGSNLQFNNKQFVNELVSWFRFSKNSAQEKGDGLWTSSMGLPKMPKLIGNIVMKNFVSAKSEAKRWKNLIDKSAGFAVFVVKENTKENWVRLGQAFERFGLKATQLNIKHAHVNMPCEEISVRQKLIQHFKIENGKQPLLLVRFGYAEAMPYSFRLPLEEVLAKN